MHNTLIFNVLHLTHYFTKNPYLCTHTLALVVKW